MEWTWLEDFVALVEAQNFSRAAERRNVAQSAFSRRIRALEDWVGAPLFDRGTHRITLTAAGIAFQPVVAGTMQLLSQGRGDAQRAAAQQEGALRVAATYGLSQNFFPGWLQAIEAAQPVGAVRLLSNSLQACEQLLLQGEADFLLCHHHPVAPGRLGDERFRSVVLGHDVLIALVRPELAADLRLPGSAETPLPHLSYSTESGMGRIMAAARGAAGPLAWLEPVFTSHVASVLQAMCEAGRGIAWLPERQAAAALAAGTLVRAGDVAWDIPMQIRLFRPRARQGEMAELVWASAIGAAA